MLERSVTGKGGSVDVRSVGGGGGGGMRKLGKHCWCLVLTGGRCSCWGAGEGGKWHLP